MGQLKYGQSAEMLHRLKKEKQNQFIVRGDLIEIRVITKIVFHSKDLKILDRQLMAKENWGII